MKLPTEMTDKLNWAGHTLGSLSNATDARYFTVIGRRALSDQGISGDVLVLVPGIDGAIMVATGAGATRLELATALRRAAQDIEQLPAEANGE